MGGRHESERGAMLNIDVISCSTRSAPGWSALLTTNKSAISITPAFRAWTSSPMPGTNISTVTSARRATSTSSWPTPTVSISTTSQPAASRIVTTSCAVGASPPSWPRVAMLRMKTPSSPARVCIRILSPRIAPPENGLVGSTAIMPTRELPRRYSAASLSTSVLFPAPGGPVIPIT